VLCAHGLTHTTCPMCVADAAAHADYLVYLHRLLNTTAAGEPWFGLKSQHEQRTPQLS
jgi:hypothetical protein